MRRGKWKRSCIRMMVWEDNVAQIEVASGLKWASWFGLSKLKRSLNIVVVIWLTLALSTARHAGSAERSSSSSQLQGGRIYIDLQR